MLAKSWLVFVCGICFSTLAAAQRLDDTWENDGTWNVTIEGDAKTARQARVVINDFAGHWQELGAKRAGDPCRGNKPYPLTVQRSNREQVEFTVWAAQVNPACLDFDLTLKKLDDSRLAGTIKSLDRPSDVRDVRLSRVPAKGKSKR